MLLIFTFRIQILYERHHHLQKVRNLAGEHVCNVLHKITGAYQECGELSDRSYKLY